MVCRLGQALGEGVTVCHPAQAGGGEGVMVYHQGQVWGEGVMVCHPAQAGGGGAATDCHPHLQGVDAEVMVCHPAQAGEGEVAKVYHLHQALDGEAVLYLRT